MRTATDDDHHGPRHQHDDYHLDSRGEHHDDHYDDYNPPAESLHVL